MGQQAYIKQNQRSRKEKVFLIFLVKVKEEISSHIEGAFFPVRGFLWERDAVIFKIWKFFGKIWKDLAYF